MILNYECVVLQTKENLMIYAMVVIFEQTNAQYFFFILLIYFGLMRLEGSCSIVEYFADRMHFVQHLFDEISNSIKTETSIASSYTKLCMFSLRNGDTYHYHSQLQSVQWSKLELWFNRDF